MQAEQKEQGLISNRHANKDESPTPLDGRYALVGETTAVAGGTLRLVGVAICAKRRLSLGKPG